MKRNIKDTVDQFHDNDLYVPTRTIAAFSVEEKEDDSESGVDSSFSKRLIKNLIMLESVNSEPITIIMNSPGGDWYHGISSYDFIKNCRSHVIIHGVGQVMSMGAVILQAADHRLLYPNTTIMMHYGEDSVSNTSKNFQRWAEAARKNNKKQEEILLEKIREKHPDFKSSHLKKMLEHDTILSAQEAVSLGLADGIIGGEKEEEE